jgi:predicted amidohydrolase
MEMTVQPFKLALIQMLVQGGQKAANLARAEERIAVAARQGAAVALLPECVDLGWTHPSGKTAAEPLPEGTSCQRLARAAARHRIHICAGLTEKAGDKVFNSAVFIDRQGDVRCIHRKLNELEIGHGCYAQGDRLNVVSTDLCTFGLMICADGFARDHVLSRSLCYMGADVILSPGAWAVPADHDNAATPYGDVWRDAYRPVAHEFGVWIAGVSNVGPIDAGPWAGRKCIGCSLVTGPDGNEVVQGPYGETAETILEVDVQPLPRPTRGCGWSTPRDHK